MRKAYNVVLRDDLSVVVAELTPHECLMAYKRAGGGGEAIQRALDASSEMLRVSIRTVNGEPVDGAVLEARGLKAYIPRDRDRNRLRRVVGDVHSPTAEQLDKARKGIVVEDDGETEIWTVTLPGGRRVVLGEIGETLMGEALAMAQKGSRSAVAVELLTAIESLRRSIRSVDGSTVDLAGNRWSDVFSMAETRLLGLLFAEMHGLDDEEPVVGEAKPVSGTA